MTIELDDAATLAADPTALRGVYGHFPTGVMAMCAMHDGGPAGFAVSSFNTISIEPPLVAVCVQEGSSTWPFLAASPRIGLSVLAANQEVLCRNLARRGRFDRFSGAGWSATPHGAVLIADAAAWLECDIHDIARYGDHDLVVLAVLRHRANDGVAPLVFHASAFRGLVA
jgi:flavin reductase (DIM6/NTAB) family NADH-FMN oxidoreductase RutF